MTSWTQPICDNCWENQRPGQEPTRIKPEYAEQEVCAFCGYHHRSGIYVRADPTIVPFPAKK